MILTGSTPASNQKKSNLADLLKTRLVYASPSPVDLTESTQLDLFLLTADLALSFLSNYATLASSIHPHPSSSSSTSSAPPPPFFGARDNKAISTLSGILGRWGIAIRVRRGVLPSSILEKSRTSRASEGGKSKISEIDEQEEDRLQKEDKMLEDGLEDIIRRTLDVILLPKGVSKYSGAGQLAALVLPQLLLPLVGALIQLAYDNDSGSSPSSKRWAIQSFFKLCQM